MYVQNVQENPDGHCLWNISVIHFLNARHVKPADTYWQICEVYGEYTMSKSVVQGRVRSLNNGHEKRAWWSTSQSSIYDEWRYLICALGEKVHEDRQFTFSSLSLHFPQISQPVLHTAVSDGHDYQKFCSQWVLKMLTEEHKMQWANIALTFPQAATFYRAGIQNLVLHYDKCLNKSRNYVRK